jgi:integrase
MSLFRQRIRSYYRPDGRKCKKAEAVEVVDGKERLLPGFTSRQTKSKKWYGQYRVDGILRRVPLASNKTAARQLLNEMIGKAERGQANLIDPFEAHRKRPLAEHLDDWKAALLADGAGAKHVTSVVGCVRCVLNGCEFAIIADLSASSVQTFLADLRERPEAKPILDASKESFTKKELAELLGVTKAAVQARVSRYRLEATGNGKKRRFPRATAIALLSASGKGISIKTSNGYLAAIKQFCRWMVQDRRMPDNPLAHLEGGNVKLDRRHDRRPLSESEVLSLLDATRDSQRTSHGLTGLDRHFLYLTALCTGFRARELASLTPEAFSLDDGIVTLGATSAKNKRTVTQPLPTDAADALRDYLTNKPAGQPVWPGSWWADGNAAEMLQDDLEAVGVPYVTDGPDGPLYADFHSLRHTFIALLDRSGATLKEAMQLARHSDPKLTMAVYGRAQLHDLSRAVSRLSGMLSGQPKVRTSVQTA